MTDQPKTRYSIRGIVVAGDGSRAPFVLSLSEPFPDERFDWQCQVVCRSFAQSPMHIYGDEPDFAWDLALSFVHLMLGLKELTVVDSDGEVIRFPKPNLARWGLEHKSDAYYLQNQ